MARPEPKICSQKWGKDVPGSRVLMVMTELEAGDVGEVCAESTGTIAANISVTILETRDRIAILPYDAWIVEGGYGCRRFWLKCTQCCSARASPSPVKRAKSSLQVI